jgi:peptide-methionine (S)-S-oxide reductase
MKIKTDTIVFGGGCFWCTEAVFEMFRGVVRTEPGYAGGSTNNPDYKRVSSGTTGHAEVLKVEYDPNAVDLDKLLDVFFSMHDPTSVNRQDADIGTQYRSMILYTSNEQKVEIEAFMKRIQKDYQKRITTEVKMLDKFYPAEDYHRKYYDKNPHQPYCMLVISSKVNKIKKKYGLS